MKDDEKARLYRQVAQQANEFAVLERMRTLGFWPKGEATPRLCDANNADTADCAFDYGWNAAKQSMDTATAAYQQIGYTASPAAVGKMRTGWPACPQRLSVISSRRRSEYQREDSNVLTTSARPFAIPGCATRTAR